MPRADPSSFRSIFSLTSFGEKFDNVITPSLQRFLPLGQELVALINRRHTRDGARLVIEDFVRDVRGDTQPCHTRDTGAAQVMKNPILNA
jgi:hypothetical protein